MSRPGFGWWGVTVYAIAMAFVETACVVSLKRLYLGEVTSISAEALQAGMEAFPRDAFLLEQAREIATLVMIGAVAFLRRPPWREGMARALWIFGIWDLLYYVFLRLVTGFPGSLADWDIVFLVPIPWIFPVWVPVLVSAAAIAVALRLHASAPRAV